MSATGWMRCPFPHLSDEDPDNMVEDHDEHNHPSHRIGHPRNYPCGEGVVPGPAYVVLEKAIEWASKTAYGAYSNPSKEQ